jgi:hypothetical protein
MCNAHIEMLVSPEGDALRWLGERNLGLPSADKSPTVDDAG